MAVNELPSCLFYLKSVFPGSEGCTAAIHVRIGNGRPAFEDQIAGFVILLIAQIIVLQL